MSCEVREEIALSRVGGSCGSRCRGGGGSACGGNSTTIRGNSTTTSGNYTTIRTTTITTSPHHPSHYQHAQKQTNINTTLMPSLAYFLDRTQQLNESIQNLKFGKPGIFTNSFIKNPPITQLLKDADYNEQVLYRVNRPLNSGMESFINPQNGRQSDRKRLETQLDLRPERVDGNSYFVDQSYGDYVEEGNIRKMRRTAVTVPKLADQNSQKTTQQQSQTANASDDITSSPTRSNNSARSKLMVDSSPEDIDSTFRVLIATVSKIPTGREEEEEEDEDQQQGGRLMMQDVLESKQEYDKLTQEINDIETIIQTQRQKLHSHNLVDIRTSSDNSNEQEEKQDIDVDELIRREEEEIQQLETELSK